MKRKVLTLLVTSALLAAVLVCLRERQEPVPSQYAELAAVLDLATRHPDLTASAVGFCLLDSRGNVVLERNARTSFIPASSLKTLTTATALEMLGPDFRIVTRVCATEPISDGVVRGDIVLVGGGDPMLSLGDLAKLAGELKGRGLRQVTGRVAGDGELFRGTIYDDFWNWGDIGNGYGSPVCGLNLEHNRYAATFRAGAAEGMPAVFLGARPEVPGVEWHNEVLTGGAGSGDGVVIHGGERTRLIHLRGTVPAGVPEFTVTGAVPDPEAYAAHHFRRALVAAGIEVDGGTVAARDPEQGGPSAPAGLVELSAHQSPALLAIVTSIHESSDNHETECLYRFLGVREKKPPDLVIREHWRMKGLKFEGLRMEDGCGLARADFIRPLDLARLQHFAGQGEHGDAYRKSLLASQDGTIRWKGGAMSGVRTITGYVTGASGAEYSFALMVNHYTNGEAVNEFREAVVAAMRRL